MYRKLASAVLVASAINAKYVYALGLGEMTMHSALNEPLNAEIQLKNIGDLDSSQIIIKMADDAQFNNAGIERPFFLSNIRFNVEVDGSGNGLVKLSSNKRVNEPYLDFLLEAKWPTGRVLRSYTALVDLPVYSQAPASSVNLGAATTAAVEKAQPEVNVAPAVVAQSANVATQAPSASDKTVDEPDAASVVESSVEPTQERVAQEPAQQDVQVVTKTSAPRSTATQDGQYRVQRGDTLWTIAQQFKPSSDVTIQQVMVAMNRMSPEAFIGGNINRLKAGSLIAVPSVEQVREIGRSEAISDVRDQNRSVSSYSSPQLDAVDAQETEQIQDLASTEGHLSLAASGSGSRSGSADQGSGVSTAEVAALENENASLNRQVDSLNNQVSQLERLLEIKQQQLAQLQNNLGEGADAQTTERAATDTVSLEDSAEGAAEEAPASPELVQDGAVEVAAADISPDLQEADIVDAPVAQESGVQEPEAQDSEVAADEAKPVAPKTAPAPAPEPSLVDTLLATPMYLGGIAVLIMGLVAGLFIRKRNQAEKEALSAFENFEFDDEEGTDEQAQAGDEVAEQTEPLEDDLASEASFEAPEDEQVEQVQEEATAPQTDDAIGEAEIYIAYGRYDQAEELLKSALAASDDLAVRNKLLEVYAQSNNQAGFVEQYQQLESQGESEAIANAKELLSTVDGGASWLEGVSGAASSASDFDDLDADLDAALDGEVAADAGLGDFDLDADDLGLDDFNTADSSDSSADVSLSDLDSELEESLSLDADLDLGEGTSSDLSAESALEDSLDLDLDLDAELDSSLESSLSEELDLGDDESLTDVIDTLEEAADDLSLDVDLEADLDASLDSDLASLDLSADDLDLGEDTSSDLSAESLDSVELDLGTGSAEELDDVSLDLDSSLDLSDELALDESLDLGVEEAVLDVSASSEAEEEVLDLGDVDLALDQDVTDEPQEEDESLDLALGDEVDLSADANAEELESAAVEADVEQAQASAEALASADFSSLDDDDLSFLSDEDEIATKLDLARAYIEMGDVDGAKDILGEVVEEGSADQQSEAESMIAELS